MIAAYIAEHGNPPPEPAAVEGDHRAGPGSRGANMFRVFCELDYRPAARAERHPGHGDADATRLTGCRWRRTGRRSRRTSRRSGSAGSGPGACQLLALWKLEFQRRGAPHLHLFTVVPDGRTEDGKHFREWLSAAWAAVVGHQDPEEYRKHHAGRNGRRLRRWPAVE